MKRRRPCEKSGDETASRRVLEFLYTRELERGDFGAANFLGLAEIRLQDGDASSALTLLRRMMLVSGEPFENFVPAADLLERFSRTREAIEFLTARVRAVPWDDDARLKLAKAQHAVPALTAIVTDPLAPYDDRTEAARLLAKLSGTPPAGISGELAVLAHGRIEPAAAEQPLYFESRVTAAEATAEPLIRARLLRGALAIQPDSVSTRLAVFRAEFAAKQYQLAVSAVKPIEPNSIPEPLRSDVATAYELLRELELARQTLRRMSIRSEHCQADRRARPSHRSRCAKRATPPRRHRKRGPGTSGSPEVTAMKIAAIFVAVFALMGIAGLFFAAPLQAPQNMADWIPSGALLYLEARDFGSLLRDWNASDEKRAWLDSGNYEMLTRSQLLGRLDQARQEFAAAAGLSPGMQALESVAGGRSALALYDIGKLEFLYISNVPSAHATESLLWQSRAKYEARNAGGSPFYVHADPASGRVVAFAVHGDYLLLGTREELVAGALRLFAGEQLPAVNQDPWFNESARAAGSPGDLRLVMNLETIRRTPYFRSYWIQRNQTMLKPYWAGIADVRLSSAEIREERVLLRRSDEPVRKSDKSAGIAD